MPIKALIDRILLVNCQVDIDANTLRQSIGTMGTLANRLATSLNDDGSLNTTAVDNALHNIACHTDGSVVISGVPYSYVRMTADERAKLELVADSATNLSIMFDLNCAPSNIPSYISVLSFTDVIFDNELLHFKQSDSIMWRIDETGSILADTNFPLSVRHTHVYGLTPTFQNPSSPDYQSYQVTSIGTPYKEQTLRVYINGVRLNETTAVYVPYNFTSDGPAWELMTYNEAAATDGIVTNGQFFLSIPITAADVIIVDFDILYT